MAPTKEPRRSVNAYRVPAMLRNLSYKLSSALSSSEVPTSKKSGEFAKATKTEDLFPTTNPAIDGDDCLHDCSSCSVKYPRKFEIDESEELYGHVKGWSTHLLVATGKTDWVRDVADEKGSIMEAVDRGSVQPSNGVSRLNGVNCSNRADSYRNLCFLRPTCPSLTTPTTAQWCFCYRHGSSSTTSHPRMSQS
jgi:hypothetical protein